MPCVPDPRHWIRRRQRPSVRRTARVQSLEGSSAPFLSRFAHGSFDFGPSDNLVEQTPFQLGCYNVNQLLRAVSTTSPPLSLTAGYYQIPPQRPDISCQYCTGLHGLYTLYTTVRVQTTVPPGWADGKKPYSTQFPPTHGSISGLAKWILLIVASRKGSGPVVTHPKRVATELRPAWAAGLQPANVLLLPSTGYFRSTKYIQERKTVKAETIIWYK